MNSVLALALGVLASYLIGSLPTAYLFAKFLKGVDIREHGSKNVGATNVVRVAGKLPGLLTLVVDVGKGALTVTLIAYFFYNFFSPGLDIYFYRALLGLCVICGHIWPVFLGFRGGKGIATTIGVVASIAPKVFVPSLVIWIAVFLSTSYVSAASIALVLSFSVLSALLKQPIYVTLLTVFICALTTYKHKDNIKRLLIGREHKMLLFKKSTDTLSR